MSARIVYSGTQPSSKPRRAHLAAAPDPPHLILTRGLERIAETSERFIAPERPVFSGCS
jgi:hypothetical protein